MNPPANIPYHKPAIGDEEIAAVTEVLRSGWLTSGPKTASFEKEFAAYVCAPHALAVNSCTAGLHLALAALGLGPGDEVITTPLTFCATVNSILHTGATPVLADVAKDGNLDFEALQRSITSKTRAILPVHFGGLPCHMEEIWRLARKHRLLVIEDAAHATGTHYRNIPIGGGMPEEHLASDVVAFSFYATKNLTTGEGGMATTHNPELMEKMKRLCLHGISKDAWNRYSEVGSWFYEVQEIGYKYNLSDIQSAIGLAQLRKQEAFLKERTNIAEFYGGKFGNMEEIELPPERDNCRHAWHLYPIRLRLEKLNISRADFIHDLKALGIGASVHFIPLPVHPAYKNFPTVRNAHCPVAMALYERAVSLPIYPGLSPEDLTRISDGVRKIVSRARKICVTGTRVA